MACQFWKTDRRGSNFGGGNPEKFELKALAVYLRLRVGRKVTRELRSSGTLGTRFDVTCLFAGAALREHGFTLALAC